MRKSRFSEDQIIGILKEHQAGIPVADLCRKHGISDATFYTWRTNGGMEVSDARKMKVLEEGNRKLKKLLAESILDVATLREAMYGPPRPCKAVIADDSVCLNVSGLSRVSRCCG
jgi:putative transposase